jgi:hypothetical protein
MGGFALDPLPLLAQAAGVVQLYDSSNYETQPYPYSNNYFFTKNDN